MYEPFQAFQLFHDLFHPSASFQFRRLPDSTRLEAEDNTTVANIMTSVSQNNVATGTLNRSKIEVHRMTGHGVLQHKLAFSCIF